MANLWAERRAKGLCGQCGKVAPVEGKSLCVKCRDAAAWSQAKYRRQHYYQISKRNKSWYDERKANGLCPYCGKRPPEAERILCTECREYHNLMQRVYREATKEKTQWK